MKVKDLCEILSRHPEAEVELELVSRAETKPTVPLNKISILRKDTSLRVVFSHSTFIDHPGVELVISRDL